LSTFFVNVSENTAAPFSTVAAAFPLMATNQKDRRQDPDSGIYGNISGRSGH
jgi:hypothetical protein